MICPYCKLSFDVEVEEFVKHTRQCNGQQVFLNILPADIDNNQPKKEVNKSK